LLDNSTTIYNDKSTDYKISGGLAMAERARNEDNGWVGWVYFAGILMIIMGIFQAISGLTALLNDEWFLVTKESLVTFDFTTWGWVHLLVGGVVIAAGSAVLNGRTWGRVVGIALATLSAIANFLFIPAYPIWSILVIVVDVLIIYALAVHGDEAAA
jgi:hypothetical protein